MQFSPRDRPENDSVTTRDSSEFTFRRAIDSVMHEFGDDPVERTKDMVSVDITRLDSVDGIAV